MLLATKYLKSKNLVHLAYIKNITSARGSQRVVRVPLRSTHNLSVGTWHDTITMEYDCFLTGVGYFAVYKYKGRKA